MQHPICPVHDLIRSQTFSVKEAKMFVRQKDTYKICESCHLHFVKMIHEAERKKNA